MPDLAPSPASPSPAPTLPDPGVNIISSPTESDAQRRWRADREAVAARDVWMQDPSKVVMRKSSDGVVSAHPRTDQAQQPDPAAAPQPRDQQQPQPQPQPQPLNSDGKIQLTPDIALSEQELKDLLGFKAAQDSKRLTAPQKPEDFKLELPADLKMPQGVEFRIDPSNPAIEPARAFALRNNLSQQQFSEMLGVYAATQASEMVAFNAAKAAEVAKLGDAANARVDAVTGWLKAMGGNHFGALARVLSLAPVAETVVGLEHLMHKYVSQGGGSFNGAHREPNVPGKVSDEVYNSMSYAQKLDYASKFDQRR
jgi:hypothetical protein